MQMIENCLTVSEETKKDLKRRDGRKTGHFYHVAGPYSREATRRKAKMDRLKAKETA